MIFISAKAEVSRKGLEKPTKERESRVCENYSELADLSPEYHRLGRSR